MIGAPLRTQFQRFSADLWALVSRMARIGSPRAKAAIEATDALVGRRPVNLDAATGYVDTPVYDYQHLRAGHVVAGPAIVEVPTTTVVVPGGSTGTVDRLGNLTIRSES